MKLYFPEKIIIFNACVAFPSHTIRRLRFCSPLLPRKQNVSFFCRTRQVFTIKTLYDAPPLLHLFHFLFPLLLSPSCMMLKYDNTRSNRNYFSKAIPLEKSLFSSHASAPGSRLGRGGGGALPKGPTGGCPPPGGQGAPTSLALAHTPPQPHAGVHLEPSATHMQLRHLPGPHLHRNESSSAAAAPPGRWRPNRSCRSLSDRR